MIRSRSWLGLRGQCWYVGAIWLLLLMAAARSFVVEFLPVRLPWPLSGSLHWLAWVLFVGFVVVALVAALRVWRGRDELEPPVVSRGLWALAWAGNAIVASLVVVLSHRALAPLDMLLFLPVQGGIEWIRQRAAPGWRPFFTRWRPIEPSLAVPSISFGDPRTYRTPGWYPDPVGAFDSRRYWDGYAWTPEAREAG